MSDPHPPEAPAPAAPAAPSAACGWRRTLALLAVPIAVLLAIWIGTATPYFAGETWAGWDLREQVLPWRVFMAWCLERGELGLWNPFLARGYDHLAEGQAGILHPVHWLVYGLLDLRLAVALELLLPMPTAVLGGYLLMRRGLRVGPLPAILAAAAMGANVFYFAHFMHVNMAWVAAHLPWLLWAASAVLRRRSLAATAGFAALMGSMWLLGHPQQVWLNGLGVAAFLAVWGAWAGWAAGWWRGLALLVLAATLGTLVGMVQILPTKAALDASDRQALSPAARENFALHPLNAVIQVAPYFLRARILPIPTVEGDKPPQLIHTYQEFPAYFGVGFLTLLVMLGAGPGNGWRDRAWRRAALAGLACAALLVLLALGPWGGLLGVTGHLPVVGAFKAPSRHIAPLFTLLGIALGLLWQRAAAMAEKPLPESRGPGGCSSPWRGDGAEPHEPAPRDRRLLLGLAVMLGVWLVAAVVQVWLARQGGLAIFGERLQVDARAGYLLLPGATVALVGLAVWGWRRSGRIVFAVAAVSLCIADAGLYALPVLRGVIKPEPRMSLDRLEHARQVMDPTAEYRHLAGLNEPVLDGYLMANGYLGLPPPDKLVLEPVGDPAIWPRHVRLASVTTIHTREGTRDFQGLPRARLVPALRADPDPLQAIVVRDPVDVALTRGGDDDFDVRHHGPPIGPDETAVIEAATSVTLRVRTISGQPRLLVLSDRYDTGWRVDIDGYPDTIIPLYDGMMMGVMLPGRREHVVTLTYRSEPLRLGALYAFAGLLGIVALLILHLRRRTPAADA